jgi:sugar lactone lactonase YvrE
VVVNPAGGVVTTLPITVNNGSIDTVTVNFARRPGSGLLWTASAVSNSFNRINGFLSNVMLAGGLAGSKVSVDARPGQGTPTAIAVDPKGNLWVATESKVIAQYLYGELETSPNGPGGVSIQVTQTPEAIAFDPAGDLWVALPGDTASGAVVEFAAANGVPGTIPSTSIPIPELTPAGPAGLAFDNLGNLWVAAANTNALVEIPAARLSSPTGGAIITNGTVTQPVAPVFDPSGRLWVVTTQNTIAAFSADQTVSFFSNTTASQVVTVNTPGSPRAAAFDNSQSLWIAEGTGNTVVQLTFAQLSTAGTQTPTTTFTPDTVTNTVSLAFNPKGQFVPLAGQHAPTPPGAPAASAAPAVAAGQGRRIGHAGP